MLRSFEMSETIRQKTQRNVSEEKSLLPLCFIEWDCASIVCDLLKMNSHILCSSALFFILLLLFISSWKQISSILRMNSHPRNSDFVAVLSVQINKKHRDSRLIICVKLRPLYPRKRFISTNWEIGCAGPRNPSGRDGKEKKFDAAWNWKSVIRPVATTLSYLHIVQLKSSYGPWSNLLASNIHSHSGTGSHVTRYCTKRNDLRQWVNSFLFCLISKCCGRKWQWPVLNTIRHVPWATIEHCENPFDDG